MTKITRIRLRNFKSFRKADIPLSDGFSAIVGANATGKSNIVDAMLFVFGITSLRLLRAAKLTELVNHEAAENYAKVEVEIKTGSKTYNISRTIDKQGRSIARLDGKKKGLNEVVALLSELGIKPTGHNIVTQGDVTRIVEMNPKQRREIIEEIAGLAEFEEKKEEAMKKLESVEERIKGVSLVLRERETYLQELEKEKEAALEYNRLTDELKRSKATALQLRIAAITKELSALKKSTEEMEKRAAARQSEKDKLIEEEKAAEQSLGEINSKLIDATQKTYATLGREVEEKKAEVRISEQKIGSIGEEITRLNERISTLKDRRRDVRAEIKNKEYICEKKSSDLKQVEAELKPIDEAEHRKAEATRERLLLLKAREGKLASVRNELAKSHEINSGLAVVLAEFQKEIDIIDSRIAQLKASDAGELAKRCEGVAKIRKGLGDAEAVVENAIRSVEASRDELPKKLASELMHSLNSMAGFNRELRCEIDALYPLLSRLSPKDEEEKLSKRRALLAEKLHVKQKEAEKIKEEAAALHKEIMALERGIAAEREKELAADQSSVLKLRGKFGELRSEVSTLAAEARALNEKEKEQGSEIEAAEKRIAEISKKVATEESRQEQLRSELEESEAELDRHTRANSVLEEEKQRLNTKLHNLSAKRTELEREIEKIQRASGENRIGAIRHETRLADLQQEDENYKGIEAIKNVALGALEKRIPEVEKEIKGLGAINMRAIEGFDEYRKEVVDVREKADKLEQERIAVMEMVNKIEVKKMNVFMECFNQINRNFSTMYYEFFGGEGRLGLTSAENPMEGGLTIEAKYSEGILKSIDAMSGGEKSLTALAFMFAVQSYQSAPFYIFDEADAALDIANSMKLARMIKEMSKKLQVISITHNNMVMKEADQLIGVALNRQKSSVVGLRLRGRIEDSGKYTKTAEENGGEGGGEEKFTESETGEESAEGSDAEEPEGQGSVQ